MYKLFYAVTLVLIIVATVMLFFSTKIDFAMGWTERVTNLVPFIGIAAGMVARFSKNTFAD